LDVKKGKKRIKFIENQQKVVKADKFLFFVEKIDKFHIFSYTFLKTVFILFLGTRKREKKESVALWKKVPCQSWSLKFSRFSTAYF